MKTQWLIFGREVSGRNEYGDVNQNKEGGYAMKKISVLLVFLLVLLTSSLGLAFEKVRFAVISDPHISIPQQKGVTDGFKLGLQTQMMTENTVAELNKIPDLQFVLVAGDLTQDAEPWNIDALRRTLDGLKVPYFVTLGTMT